MTAVVGIEYRGKVWLGGDSGVCDEDYNVIGTTDDPKVWVRGGVAFGGSGDGRYMDLVRFALKIPKLPRGEKPDTIASWMVLEMCPALRECWAEETKYRPPKDPMPPVELLIGVRGRLHVLGGDLSVVHPADGMWAIGSGGREALGTLVNASGPAKGRLARALTAAEKRTAFVAPPFRYVSA